MNAPAQIAMYLPAPLTAREHASALGKLGGKARAEQLREPIRSKTREMRAELGMADAPALGRVG